MEMVAIRPVTKGEELTHCYHGRQDGQQQHQQQVAAITGSVDNHPGAMCSSTTPGSAQSSYDFFLTYGFALPWHHDRPTPVLLSGTSGHGHGADYGAGAGARAGAGALPFMYIDYNQVAGVSFGGGGGGGGDTLRCPVAALRLPRLVTTRGQRTDTDTPRLEERTRVALAGLRACNPGSDSVVSTLYLRTRYLHALIAFIRSLVFFLALYLTSLFIFTSITSLSITLYHHQELKLSLMPCLGTNFVTL